MTFNITFLNRFLVDQVKAGKVDPEIAKVILCALNDGSYGVCKTFNAVRLDARRKNKIPDVATLDYMLRLRCATVSSAILAQLVIQNELTPLFADGIYNKLCRKLRHFPEKDVMKNQVIKLMSSQWSKGTGSAYDHLRGNGNPVIRNRTRRKTQETA